MSVDDGGCSLSLCVVRCLLPIACCLLFIVCCSVLFVVCRCLSWLFVVCFFSIVSLLFVDCCVLFVVCCLLRNHLVCNCLLVCCGLLEVRCWLFVVGWLAVFGVVGGVLVCVFCCLLLFVVVGCCLCFVCFFLFAVVCSSLFVVCWLVV